MRLVNLRVRDFGCVREADVQFGPGLNVLFGPNDLGKSSLAEAIRFALLLQHGSSYSESFAPWRSDATPSVDLVFQTEPQRFWRVRKTFGAGSRGSSVFEFSKDCESFSVEAKARAVDAEIRKHLRWGIPEPGGRGGPKGLPESFLTTVLLARQDGVTELFGRNLGEDPDESGRKRIAEALQAAAQDPLFAKVLERTQGRVDEAFTPTGRYRKGRTSPFTQVKDQLDKAEREFKDLEDRVLDSQATRDRVRELAEQVVFEEQERDSAKAALQQIDAVLAKEKQVVRAQTELSRVEALNDAAKKAEDARKSAADEAEILRKQLEEVQGEVGQAGTCVAEAKEEVARLQSGEGAQARLARQRGLEKEVVELKAEVERVESQTRAAQQAKEIDARVRATEEELGKLEAEIKEEETELAGHDRSVEEAQENLRALKGISLWIRRQELQGRIDKAKGSADRKVDLEKELAEADARAKELEQEVANSELPTKAAISELRGLERALRLAEAKLDVALNVGVEAAKALDIEVAGKREQVAAGTSVEFDGTGELVLNLVDIAKLRVRGGSVDAQKELDEARDKHESIVAPALKSAAVANLDELDQSVADAGEKAAEVERLRSRVESLRGQLKALSDAAEDTATLESRLKDVEEQLADYPHEVLEERAKGFGPAQLTAVEGEITKCEDVVNGAKDRRASLEKSSAANDSKRQSLKARLAEVTESRDKREKELGAPWAEVIETTERRRGELTADLERKSGELEALASGEETELQNARSKLEEAEASFKTVKEELAQRDKAHKETKKHVDELAGEARVRREAADAEDYDAAKAVVNALAKERDALPRPENVDIVTEEVREAAARRLDEADRSVGGVRSELHTAEGALAQVGGEVVRERRDGALAALNRFREAERNLELEYNGWLLLLETLKEAEKSQATHLGQSMVEPIAKRFAELTASRYGELNLGPELEVGGIEAFGGTREIEQLSVGTREQLSTVFRLSLAEQLESAVLLDDQLTQTDPKRMNWFKQRLREFAGKIQVVVLTCRPQDYLQDNEIQLEEKWYGSEDGTVRAVNLERVVERAL